MNKGSGGRGCAYFRICDGQEYFNQYGKIPEGTKEKIMNLTHFNINQKTFIFDTKSILNKIKK